MTNTEYDNWKLSTPEDEQNNSDEEVDNFGAEMDRAYEKNKDEL